MEINRFNKWSKVGWFFGITKGTEKEKNNLCLSLGHFDARTIWQFLESVQKKNTSALQRHLATLPTPLPIKFHKTEKFAHWSCVVLGWGGVAFIRLRSPKSFFGTLLMRNTGAVRCRGAHSEDKNWRVVLVKLHYNANKMRTAIIPRRSIMFNRNMLYSLYIYIYII